MHIFVAFYAVTCFDREMWTWVKTRASSDSTFLLRHDNNDIRSSRRHRRSRGQSHSRIKSIAESGKRIARVGNMPAELMTTASIIMVMLSGTGADMV
jgi:hypothetical protein